MIFERKDALGQDLAIELATRQQKTRPIQKGQQLGDTNLGGRLAFEAAD